MSSLLSRSFRLLTAVLLAACASAPPPPLPPPPAPPPPPPPPPPAVVIADEEANALAGLIRMEDRRELDIDRLRELLANPSVLVRRYAALAGGRIGDRRASPLLVVALIDPSPAVRANAAFALGLLGDTASTVVYALAMLARAPDDHLEPSVEAVAALGRIAAPTGPASATNAAPIVLSVFRQLLQRYAPSPTSSSATRPMDDVGREVLVNFWRIPRLDAVVDLVLPHFQAGDVETRWRAVYPFTRHPMKAIVPQLRDRLKDDDPTVRSLAARVLRAAPVDSAGERTVTLDALVGLLKDGDARVRINTLGAIATYRDAATITAIAALTTHEHGNTRIAAIQALGVIGGTAAADAIAPILSDTSAGIGIRDAALAALLRASADRGLNAVQPLVGSAAWLERFHAARALGSSVWPAGAPLLRQLARDKDPRVAAAALRSITTSADSAAGVQPIFLEALAAGDPGIRAAAASGLARRPNPANMAALMEAYERARFDSVSTAALAIVDALAGLEGQGLPVARAFFLRFPPARDPVVHRRVALRLGPNGWGPPQPWGADRDASFYRSLVDRYVVPALRDQLRPRIVMGTPYGEIQLELDAEHAPVTVLNFLRLADEGYFANGNGADTRERRWHRVVPNFVLQAGDSRGDGTGGPGYTIRDEINRLRYGRGVLGMAHAGADTGGSQFFITLSPQPHLDGGYTVFGHVTGGMDAADRVTQEDLLHYIRVVR